MAISRQQKELTVQQLGDRLSRMTSVVFTSFAGLTVKDATTLRQQLRQSGADYVVTKKTLLRRALQAANLDATLADQLTGGQALTFGYADEGAPVKLLHAFARTHPAVVLSGAIVQGGWLNQEAVKAFALLPGREDMLGLTVRTIQAPLTGMVNVLAGNLRSLINALNSLKDKQPAPAGS